MYLISIGIKSSVLNLVCNCCHSVTREGQIYEVKIRLYIYIYIQSVTGGTDQTSGGCPLGHTIPI